MMVHVLEEVIIKPRLTPHTHFENIHVTKNKTVIQLEIVIGKKMLLATHMLFSFLEWANTIEGQLGSHEQLIILWFIPRKCMGKHGAVKAVGLWPAFAGCTHRRWPTGTGLGECGPLGQTWKSVAHRARARRMWPMGERWEDVAHRGRSRRMLKTCLFPSRHYLGNKFWDLGLDPAPVLTLWALGRFYWLLICSSAH